MSKPIYVMWRANARPNAYELSEEEWAPRMEKRQESLASVGGEDVLRFDTRWANEKWAWAGVVKYPSLEAYQKDVANLEELEWWRYIESETLLGTLIGGE